MRLFTPAQGRRLVFGLRRVIGKPRTDKLMTHIAALRYRCRVRTRLRVEVLDQIRPDSVFISGTIDDPKHRVVAWELVFSGGRTVAIVEQPLRLDGKSGILDRRSRDQRFIALVDTSTITPSALPTGLRLTKSNGRSLRRAIQLSPPAADPIDRIRNILDTVPHQAPSKRKLFDRIIGPTLLSIWASRIDADTTTELQRFNAGSIPTRPEATLIIPIYGRHDFIEHQLSHFCNDATFSRFQVLYVVDDPRIGAAVHESCAMLARIYPIGFDILFLSRNVGYAAANNHAVRHADAPQLLLMNSDVMPCASGWLSAMLRTHANLTDPGILGARLIYEDGTVQHDGMRFERSPFLNDLWTNVHPGKGLPADLFDSSLPVQPREAVTGACLLVDKAEYVRLGGLDESYILGDFEDSDFCLRARAAGLSIHVDPAVTLYHLERQSQSLVSTDRWKQELTYYNCWTHTNRWDSTITALKRDNVHG